MPIELGRVPDRALVEEAIRMGEGEQIEFKVSVPDPISLARTVSAFANTSGGLLFIGIDENDREIVTFEGSGLGRRMDQLLEQSTPVPEATLHSVEVNGKDVGVIVVKPSPRLVITKAGAFARVGATDRPMTSQQLQVKLAPQGTQAVGILHFSVIDALKRLTETTDTLLSDTARLRAELAYSQSLRGQWKFLLIGFISGIGASVIASYVYNALNPPAVAPPPAIEGK